MYNMKKLVVASLGLVGFWFLFAVAAPAEAGETETKVIKSKASATFVSANFDFDNPNLKDPANYHNGAGISSAGKFTFQAVAEFAPDKHTCTLPGGVAGAGTEFALVADVQVSRFTATGDLLFTKGTSATLCEDFSTSPTPPFPFIFTETGVVTGGTGKYSGATGTFTATGDGATLSVDATGARLFGWFENKEVTTLTVP
jgi:hypothetical protein